MRTAVIILAMLALLSTPVFSQTFVAGTVPHYSEFEVTENPNGYYWCGHAALKAVGNYITGTTKSLNSLHKTFLANSPQGYGANDICLTNQDWCARLSDLFWAAEYSKNNGYGRADSVIRIINRGTSPSLNYSGFYTQIKAGINANYPAIIPSNWYYANAGHFFIVTGYKDMGDVQGSYLYLRDVAKGAPVYAKYDRVATVKAFFDSTKHSGNTIQILYVK